MSYRVLQIRQQSAARIRNARLLRCRQDPVITLREHEFFARYRMTKEVFKMLLSEVKPRLRQFHTKRGNPFTKKHKLLIALRYYASGTFQLNVGDYFGATQPSVSRIVKNVSKAIASLKPRYLKWPRNTDMSRISEDFASLDNIGLPGIVGAIDCVHIQILMSLQFY